MWKNYSNINKQTFILLREDILKIYLYNVDKLTKILLLSTTVKCTYSKILSLKYILLGDIGYTTIQIFPPPLKQGT